MNIKNILVFSLLFGSLWLLLQSLPSVAPKPALHSLRSLINLEDSLLNKARAYRDSGKVDSALIYFLKVENEINKEWSELFIILNNTKGSNVRDFQLASRQLSQIKIDIAQIFKEQSVYDKAVEYLLKADTVTGKTTSPTLQENISRELAETYEQWGDQTNNANYYEKAIEQYDKLAKVLPDRIDSLTTQEEIAQIHTKRAALEKKGSSRKRVYLQKAIDSRKPILEGIEQIDASNTLLVANAKNNLALSYQRLGSFYADQSPPKLDSALANLDKSFALINQISNLAPSFQKAQALVQANRGVVLQNLGSNRQALDDFEQARQIYEDQDDTLETAHTQNLIAQVKYYNRDYKAAEAQALEALDGLNKLQGDSPQETDRIEEELTITYDLLNRIYEQIGDYRTASEAKDSLFNIRLTQAQRNNERNKQETRLKGIEGRTLRQIQLSENNELKEANERIKKQNEEIERQRQEADRLRSIAEEQTKEAVAAKKEAENALNRAKKAEADAKKQAALAKDNERKAKEQKEKADSSAEAARKSAEDAQNQKKIAEAKEKEAKDNAEKAEKNAALFRLFLIISIIGAIAVISVILYFNYKNRQKNRQLQKLNNSLYEERQKADKLLLNILPESIADELKQGEIPPLVPPPMRPYERVSILFTDFKGFTDVSATMTPDKLMEELNDCFSGFDEIVKKHNLEKIKTIGDAYMCAGGIPEPNPTNPVDAVLAGLEMQAFMDKRRKEKLLDGDDYWQCRLGINTGEIRAGVIGRSKFAYDIWGSPVNIASRMESGGEVNRVNISEATYGLVKDFFECESRGRKEVKNGLILEMFFVNRIKPELSADQRGIYPNTLFYQKVEEKFGQALVVRS